MVFIRDRPLRAFRPSRCLFSDRPHFDFRTVHFRRPSDFSLLDRQLSFFWTIQSSPLDRRPWPKTVPFWPNPQKWPLFLPKWSFSYKNGHHLDLTKNIIFDLKASQNDQGFRLKNDHFVNNNESFLMNVGQKYYNLHPDGRFFNIRKIPTFFSQN